MLSITKVINWCTFFSVLSLFYSCVPDNQSYLHFALFIILQLCWRHLIKRKTIAHRKNSSNNKNWHNFAILFSDSKFPNIYFVWKSYCYSRCIRLIALLPCHINGIRFQTFLTMNFLNVVNFFANSSKIQFFFALQTF